MKVIKPLEMEKFFEDKFFIVICSRHVFTCNKEIFLQDFLVIYLSESHLFMITNLLAMTKTHFRKISFRNSESFASVFLQNLEEMFPQY